MYAEIENNWGKECVSLLKIQNEELKLFQV